MIKLYMLTLGIVFLGSILSLEGWRRGGRSHYHHHNHKKSPSSQKNPLLLHKKTPSPAKQPITK